MKKIVVVVSAILVALVIFGAGFIFAQSNIVSAAGLPVGYGPGGVGGGRFGMGQIHEYVEQALADKLGMTKADVETALASGKSMVQIAVDKGTQAADLNALLTDVHKTAFAKAVSDGVMTQAQADAMLQMMTSNGFSFSDGSGRFGGGYGRGGMMGPGGRGGMMNPGGRGYWNQQQPGTNQQ